MSSVEQVRIARNNNDGKGHYTIINKRDLKKGDVLWDEKAHNAKFNPTPKATKKRAKKK